MSCAGFQYELNKHICLCDPQKCTEYWPEDSVVCEGIEITVKQVIQADDYSLRIFTVKVCLVFECVLVKITDLHLYPFISELMIDGLIMY